MITREIVIRNGEPVWLLSSGGYSVECKSGTQAAAIMEALEASKGLPPTRQRSLEPPRRGPDMIPDPGV